ncbi:MAG: hypothetical protein VB085_03860 [Peptococcaceae bacterium]|nr:hypothetical protein [Peptococcaceae bacterium]
MNSAGLENSRRAVLGTFGQEPKFADEYHLYVRKGDYAEAMFILHAS